MVNSFSSEYSNKPWLAHYHVPAELPIPSISLVDAFENTARRIPNVPAIHYFDYTISFGRLNELATRFAAMLAARGVGKGDRVAISFQNDPQFVIAQLGVWKRGGVVAPLNPMFKAEEVDAQLADSGARVWIRDASMCPGHAPVEHCISVRLEDVEMTDILSGFEAAESVRVQVGPEDVAYLVYTSGTTGKPKGAINLHRNVLFNAEVYRTWMGLRSGEALLCMAPLFHVTGLVAQLAVSAHVGMALILFHRFDAIQALELSQRWRPAFSIAALTAYIALLNAKTRADQFAPICYSGGAPVSQAITEQFEQRFGVYIHNIYGLTESNSPSHAVPYGVRAPVDCGSGALSVGVPVPNCEAKIVDLADSSRELPVGEAGELALKGPMIFAGYWNQPEATKEAFRDGFFLTGDIAVMDERGWFYIVDRKKDMIIASGFKVWPREVEDILYRHPGVREASVVGIADPYRGETVKAFIALRTEFTGQVDASEIVTFCRERLAAYKCPRQVEFVAEMPKTATGKILRRALRGV